MIDLFDNFLNQIAGGNLRLATLSEINDLWRIHKTNNSIFQKYR